MTINRKLILATMLAGISILASVFFSLQAMNRLQDTMLTQQHVLEIEAYTRQLQQAENNFLFRRDKKGVETFAGIARQVLAHIETLVNDHLIPQDQDTTDTEHLRETIAAYVSQFQEVATVRQRIGLDEISGLYGSLRESVHKAEDLLKQYKDDKLLKNMLTLRRNEKDFMLRLEQKYVDQFIANYDLTLANLEANPAFNTEDKQKLHGFFSKYREDFLNLVEGYQEMGLNYTDGKLGKLLEISNRAKETLTALEDKLDKEMTQKMRHQRTMLIFILAGFAAAIIVFLLLTANTIRHSVLVLMKGFRGLVERNDLETRLPIKNRDEMGEIAVLFNSYMDKIKHGQDIDNHFIQATSTLAEQIKAGKLMVRLQETANNPGLNTLRDFVNQMLAQLTAVFALIKYKLEQLDKGNFSNQLDADFIKKHGEIYQRLSGDFEEINRSLQNTALRLAETTEKNHTQNWIKTGQAQLNEVLSGDQSLKKLAEKAINFLTPYLNAQVGAFYLMELTIDKVPQLRLVATHAYTWRKSASTTYKIGEGIVGQAAYEGKPFVIGNAPEGHMLIDSGLGESAPRAILVMPFMYEGEIKGVMELATLESFTQSQLDFLSQAMQILAVAIHTAQSHDRVQELLEQAQAQSAVLQQQTQELEQQQSALQQSNEQLQSQSEELQAQTEELQSQTEELQSQQEELRQTNEALEMRGKELERQREAVRQQNHELEKAQAIVEAKAEELALASKYKSEFLANMSHELRTPLNSLLILAQMLMENKEGRLSEKQVEYARTIHVSGKDLLSLINEILDLSKVEAGKIDLHPETCNLKHLIAGLEQKFRHMADGKKLSFKIQTVPQLPETLHVDTQRLKQIINNLLSNAFKFTHDGGVTLEIRRPLATEDLSRSGLEAARGIAICVSDTGIGIPKDKQKTVFEAFQQADGSTSRKYGGTGLGLSISRQLAQVMGGEIHLDSEPGHGSRFCVFLPERFIPNAVPEEREAEVVTPPRRQPESKPAAATTPEVSPASAPVAIQDDREKLKTDSKSLLVIEDDPTFAKLLMQLAREKGFLCLYAADGQAGLRLVETYKPGAIILDVGLPQVDGWTVMERLKDSADTRHIPVHFVSGADYHQEARRMGAVGYSLKPVSMMELSDAFHKIERIISKSVKSLLLVSDSEKHHQAILDILDNDALDIQVRATQAEALQELQRRLPDCLILDAGVENSSGIRLLETLAGNDRYAQIPVLLCADRELESAEEEVLKQVADLLTVKSIHSPERLLDEATLFLHQVEAKLPQAQQQTLRMMHDKETILKGKKVMIVDDDMRNTFALSATLEEKAVEVLIAANGLESLAMLAENPDTALVLMDIMMPEMDGYEAMRKIREQPALRKLPIIALTAKAMKGDRAKCIEAGASDYLAKPVDTNKLLSLLRVWLYQ